MREFVHRPAVRFTWLLALAIVALNSSALAQAREPTAPAHIASPGPSPVRQVALTEKQIKGFLAASSDIRSVTDNAPEDVDKLSPKTVAQLDAVARKNGFASYDEYNLISENIGLVIAGYDTVNRTYVGKEALIKSRIARVQADQKMSADSKQEKLRDLQDDLGWPLPRVAYKNNIGLVVKYRDQLIAAMRGDE